MTSRSRFPVILLVCASLAPHADAQQPDPGALLAAQREAMRTLSFMDGAWRGTGTHTAPDGTRHALVQTERIGPFLDGTLKVIEGRGYGDDGKVAFNAFGIVSFDPATKAYNFRSHAMGHSGDFAFKPSADGFVWEIPAGPATMRYTARIADGTWHEIGERIVPGQPSVQFFEMTLRRIGDSDWPAGGAIAPK